MRAFSAFAIALIAISLACAPQPTAPGPDELTLIAGVTVRPGSLVSFEHQNDSHVTFGVLECGPPLEALRNPDGTYRFRLGAFAVNTAIDPGVHDIVSESFRVRR